MAQRTVPPISTTPHFVGIALAEQRDGTHRLAPSLIELFGERAHLEVRLRGLVGDLFDLGALVVGQRTLPVKVPVPSGPVQRSPEPRWASVAARHAMWCPSGLRGTRRHRDPTARCSVTIDGIPRVRYFSTFSVLASSTRR